MEATTLYEKVWNDHTVKTYEDGETLLYIDRHLVQEVSSPQAFAALDAAGETVRRPDAHIAVADHAVPTIRSGTTLAEGLARRQVERLVENAARHGITYIPTDDVRHGIVHVVGPELGFTLPGLTLVCGDSHTCTHGAFGCIAFGIGASECISVFRAQCLRQARQKTMRVTLGGDLQPGVTSKDVILALIARHGTGFGVGYALEYAGPPVSAMSMEERMTLCNMSIEAGSRVGLISPDDTTFAYLKGRPLAPSGKTWIAAVARWRALATDDDAVFDREVVFDVTTVAPQVSSGTSPDLTLPVSGALPDPREEADPERRAKYEKSLAYMGLDAGTPLRDIQIDRVFVGSCTNGRLEDLRAAARVLEGRRIAEHVQTIVVPGSMSVRRAAEREGLDRIFLAAGAEWRQSGCSMCVGMNDDRLEAGERCASTSNRNFEGRQGKGGRTHLMSPQMAAAAAVAGHIIDYKRARRLVKLLTAVPAPFLEDNVDTDVIFPARFLLLLERDGLAKYAFFERRTADPDFVLGRPPYSGTSILVAGNNFGTGSSREQAVWSLADLGIRCVIARSFGEIFHANCFRNGMVPILCDGPDMARIEADADAGREISVDLEAQEILSSGGPPIRFEISPHRKAALMSGLDEVGQILKENLADIEAYETRAAGHDPWTVIPAARYEALRAEMTEPVADTP